MNDIIEIRNKIAIARIDEGATWEDLEIELGVTRVYLQSCLKRYLEEREYQLLLGVARANAKTKYIDVVETGSLLNAPELLENKLRVFAPSFCRDEIRKLAPESDMINSPKISWANIRWEHINISPDKRVKPRTIGVVAFCCTMAKRNRDYIIRVYTNSKDIEDLLVVQKISNIKIIKC